MTMITRYRIVFTTYSKARTGTAIINALLSKRLAACVQVFPIRSFFIWRGRLSREPENLMLIKARSRDFQGIKRVILENHDYEIPEILSVPIDQGFAGYLRWMDRAVRRPSRAHGARAPVEAPPA